MIILACDLCKGANTLIFGSQITRFKDPAVLDTAVAPFACPCRRAIYMPVLVDFGHLPGTHSFRCQMPDGVMPHLFNPRSQQDLQTNHIESARRCRELLVRSEATLPQLLWVCQTMQLPMTQCDREVEQMSQSVCNHDQVMKVNR